ncbi:hypothetical protein ACWDZ4_20070 [Streptomyces sp. NPDC003016]
MDGTSEPDNTRSELNQEGTTVPTTLTSLTFTASAVMGAARQTLGPGWMTFPANNGSMEGSIRSHKGHRIELLGAQNGLLFTAALLSDGTRQEAHIAPDALTATAYGSALARMITDTIVPAHDARCQVLRAVSRIGDALAGCEHTTAWDFGAAHTVWELTGGGRAHSAVKHALDRSPHDVYEGGTGLDASVTFADLNITQAVVLLRSLDLTNDDVRQHDRVYGTAARMLKTAAPGLRVGDMYNWPTLGGRCTVTMGVDDMVRVEIHHSDDPRMRITVTGSLDNQLAAIRAL